MSAESVPVKRDPAHRPGYEKLLQSDYFVDLTSDAARHLTSERSVHVLGALERERTPARDNITL